MQSSRLEETYPTYSIEDRSVEVLDIPLWTWLLMVLLIIFPLVFYMGVWGMRNLATIEWLWLVYTFALLVLHELTHAVAWKLASGLPWKALTFGVQWKTLTPYCHSKEPMPVLAYRIGACMPLIVTGIVPWVMSMIGGDPELAMAASLLISGAGGDIYILWSIRDLPADALVQDHDSRAGCLVLWPK